MHSRIADTQFRAIADLVREHAAARPRQAARTWRHSCISGSTTGARPRSTSM